MESYQDLLLSQDLSGFTTLFVSSQIAGLLCIILVVTWGAAYGGGFSGPSSPATWFNWHPFFMTLGLIVVQGDSILIYRVLRHEPKPRLKLIHAGLHFFAFAVVVIGLKCVFDFHNNNIDKQGHLAPIPNLYSLHSWIGLLTVILFGLQFVIGFVSFLVPGVRRSLRTRLLPLHVHSGTVIFLLSVCSALMGITEKNIFVGNYSALPTGASIFNALGVFIVIFGQIVYYLVSKQSFKRIAPPEEQVLHLDYSEEELRRDD